MKIFMYEMQLSDGFNDFYKYYNAKTQLLIN